MKIICKNLFDKICLLSSPAKWDLPVQISPKYRELQNFLTKCSGSKKRTIIDRVIQFSFIEREKKKITFLDLKQDPNMLGGSLACTKIYFYCSLRSFSVLTD